MDRVADSGQDGGAAPGVEENELSGAPDDLMSLYQGLLEADDQGDAATLARLGWILFEVAGKAQDGQRKALVLLTELRAAASAVSAGEGSCASLALLRHVLSKHGWLPPPDATPLQVLAGSYPHARSRVPGAVPPQRTTSR